MRYIDVDGVNRTYNNSSQAQLDIPATATIKWAGIYTQKGTLITTMRHLSQTLFKKLSILPPPLWAQSALTPEIIDLYANASDGYTYDTYAPINAFVGKKRL